MERTKHGEFNWIDLSARDLEGQTTFYEGLFGWSHEDVPFAEGMVYRMFKADGHSVGGMSQLAPEMISAGQPSAWNNYLAADDVDTAAAKAVELGGTVVVEPMDVPGQGRMAAVQDPTGAYIFLWKAVQSDETIEYRKPGTLSWTDLSTREPEKAAEFYAAWLGWDIQAMETDGMPYWQVDIDGQGQAGIMPMADMLPPEVPAFWMPYFGSVDVAADVATAKGLGATVLAEPTQVADMLVFSVLADPAGATFGLLQPLQMPEG